LKAENFAVQQTRDSELIRYQDSASQTLFKYFSKSTSIPTVTVDAVRNGKTVWRAELSDVIISGVQVTAIPRPVETLALNFVSIKTIVGNSLKAAAESGGGLARGAWSLAVPAGR
jgi:type VI protein secretion system component Hcp